MSPQKKYLDPINLQSYYLQESFQFLNPEKWLLIRWSKRKNYCSVKILQVRELNFQLNLNHHLNFGLYISIICKYLDRALLVNLMQHFFLLFFYLNQIHEKIIFFQLLILIQIHHFTIFLLYNLVMYVGAK